MTSEADLQVADAQERRRGIHELSLVRQVKVQNV
jgi:hypothetical protein